MNPYSNDVQGYLTSIALELANLGFDEVLFDDFYFPDSDRISWTGSVTKQEAILDAADNLSANLLNQAIRLDLGTSDPEVAAYASRVFIETNNASQIDSDKELLADAIPGPCRGNRLYHRLPRHPFRRLRRHAPAFGRNRMTKPRRTDLMSVQRGFMYRNV